MNEREIGYYRKVFSGLNAGIVFFLLLGYGYGLIQVADFFQDKGFGWVYIALGVAAGLLLCCAALILVRARQMKRVLGFYVAEFFINLTIPLILMLRMQMVIDSLQ